MIGRETSPCDHSIHDSADESSSEPSSNLPPSRCQLRNSWSLSVPVRASFSYISCYDIKMKDQLPVTTSDSLLGTLAEFRYELRCFLHFSECAALEAGLHPRQHQLLLQVAGAPQGAAVTIAYAAERLGLRHHSAVELVDRSVREGLLARTADPGDRRRAILRVTRKGRQVLGRLTGTHARELNELAPRLAQVLERITTHARHVAGTVPR